MKQMILTGFALLLFACGNKTTESSIGIDKAYFLLGTSTDCAKQYLFETDLQKISFITGVYSRYNNPEETNDSLYSMKLADSDSKAQICIKLLKELGCTNMEYIYYKGDNSDVSVIHFIPTTDLKKQIDLHTNEK